MLKHSFINCVRQYLVLKLTWDKEDSDSTPYCICTNYVDTLPFRKERVDYRGNDYPAYEVVAVPTLGTQKNSASDFSCQN